MNLDNLTAGQVVPNYRVMCQLLNEPERGGTAKTAQGKVWSRHFTFTKKGHKYIIHSIHPEPLPTWANDKSLYVRLVELLLVHELAKQPPGSFICHYSKTNLFRTLGMVNDNYRQHSALVNKDLASLSRWQVEEFYKNSTKKLSSILFNALRSMHDRRLIDYSHLRVIIEDDEERIADDDEVAMIIEVEHRVLVDMGYKMVTHIPYHEINTYYKNVSDRLLDEYGWSRAYQEIQIIFTHEHIINNIPVITQELEQKIAKYRSELNANVIESLHNYIDYKYQKNWEQYQEAYAQYEKDTEDEWGELPPIDCDDRIKIPEFFSFPSTYRDTQRHLTGLLIDMKHS